MLLSSSMPHSEVEVLLKLSVRHRNWRATGGKQYKVAEGDIIKVEKLGVEAGETFTFDQVLAVSDNGLKVGNPTVAGATVEASVVENGKAKKVIVYKYKRKTGYHKKNGHAEYADPGQDIVCAAASILVINTINAIEEFTEDDASLISEDEMGMISYHLNHPSKDAQLLLNTMILGLEQMVDDDNYAEYIDLTFEEV